MHPGGATAGAGLATDFDTSAGYFTSGPAIGIEASVGGTFGILGGDLCDFAGLSRNLTIGPLTFTLTDSGKLGVAVTLGLGTGVSYTRTDTKLRGPFLEKCGCPSK